MPQSLFANLLHECVELGTRNLAISGGEPFLFPDHLESAAKICGNTQIICTVVTSAAWATSDATCDDLLTRLIGIKGLCISWDPWHESCVPKANVHRLAAAGMRHGLSVEISGCYDATGKGSTQWMKESLGPLLSANVLIYTQPLVPRGRATIMFPSGMFPEINTETMARCGSLRNPVVLPNGKVYACCGIARDLETEHELKLGTFPGMSLRSISNSVKTKKLLLALRRHGPEWCYAQSVIEGKMSYEKQIPVRCRCDWCYRLIGSRWPSGSGCRDHDS